MIDHAVRARGIGGSEIAAILGLDPRRDAYSVWAEKLGLVRRKPPHERMEAGKFLEQGIAHWYGISGESLVRMLSRCRSTYSANGTATYSTCPGGTWRPASAATNWISTG